MAQRLFAATNDHRLVMSDGRDVWAQQVHQRGGEPLWEKLPRTGLPRQAIVGLLTYHSPIRAVAVLASGEAYEYRRDKSGAPGLLWERVELPGEEAP